MTPPYTYEVIDNKFYIYQFGDLVHMSRVFRLQVQAEAKAKKFIKALEETLPDDFILEVQSLSIDPDTLFGGRKDG